MELGIKSKVALVCASNVGNLKCSLCPPCLPAGRQACFYRASLNGFPLKACGNDVTLDMSNNIQVEIWT